MYAGPLVYCKPDNKDDEVFLTPRSAGNSEELERVTMTALEREQRKAKKKLMVDNFPNEYKNTTSTYVFKEYEENEPVSYHLKLIH